MSAILFGSIGTVVETSELQRQAFNEAFEVHGLDWYWHRAEYLEMLEKSGGQKRIADYADSVGQTVDAAAIHRSKSEIFQKHLVEFQVSPRLGVVETIQSAKNAGLRLALVTTTSPENVAILIKALRPAIQPTDFDLILNAESVKRPKPNPDAYVFALEKLGEKPDSCIAIEDNQDGLEAAVSAGLTCVAFPGENTTHHNFTKAQLLVHRLDFDPLRQRFLSEQVDNVIR